MTHLTQRQRRYLHAALCALLLGGFMLTGAVAQTSDSMAVLYPDIGEPHRNVLATIIQGIKQRAKIPVIQRVIAPSTDPQEIAEDLQRQNVRVVIALGRVGLKLATQLGPGMGVVIGAVVTVPEAEVRGFTVASLAPDPAAMLAQLRGFMPTVKQVFVVYDPSQNRWLMRLAQTAAAAHGIKLRPFEATDLRTALQHYQKILSSMDPVKDALWLPLDTTTVNESNVLPLALQEAWTRNLTVFSSNLAHVRRGALFSLYPDNTTVGHHLADQALQQLQPSSATARGVLPLKDALLAVNVRTAAHLGIDVAAQQSRVQLTFPE